MSYAIVNLSIRCSIPSYQNDKLSCCRLPITDVEAIMGIPCHGLDVSVHPRSVANG